MHTRHASKSRFFLFIASIITSTACSGSSDGASGSAPAGSERGPCLEGGTCDEGLECRSDLCVEATSTGTGGGSSAGSGGDTSGSGGTSSAGTSSGGTSSGGTSSGGTAGDGGSVSSGGTTVGSGGASGDASAPACMGSHPNVEGTQRFCDPGSCYCSDPFDTCFEGTVAAECCNVDPRCGDTTGDRGVVCEGGHPIIGPPRTCDPGNCLCSGTTTSGNMVDACYPEAVARACCPPSIDIACVAP